MKANRKRVVIVGGVAGGASCAARLRRLDEKAEIVIFERGPHVSFANCGLPYYIGGVIADEEALLVTDAERLNDRMAIEVRTETEVIGIHRRAKEVEVRHLPSGKVMRERYDALVLSPGAAPIRPPLPGIDLPGIFTVRSIPDSRAIREWIAARGAKRAVVVGAGFIGLEMAENLVHLGLRVTLVEMLDQVMPPLDAEVAHAVERRLREEGVMLALGDGVAGFQNEEEQLIVETAGGKRHCADLVILAIGVRPETALARGAGLRLGERGGIAVNAAMRTSDRAIWAVGDAVEVTDRVSGGKGLVPLAGPANRQGRGAAESIAGRRTRFPGVLGTAVCGVFGLEVAMTGKSGKALRRAGISDYEAVYLFPLDHAEYYPGAKPLLLKLLFQCGTGRLLGAQAVGEQGAARRIDVIASVLALGGTVYDLEQSELCYAPQFGSAKDPVNLAGMVAAAVLRGEMPVVQWHEPDTERTRWIDVRAPEDYHAGHLPGAMNLPLEELRGRMEEVRALAAHGDLRVYCEVGQRGYLATRLLLQRGIAVRNLTGGYRMKCLAERGG